MTLEMDRIGVERQEQPIGMTTLNVLSQYGDKIRWVLDPPFQRGSVWSLEQKQAWIESVLMGLSLPSLIVNRFQGHKTYGYQSIVIDGQQRLRATAEFMRSEFSVRGEFYKDQGEVFRRQWELAGTSITTIICRYKTLAECAKLYLKLLSTGTAHTPAEIQKAQEFVDAQG
jgi:hypothetical protein